MIAAKTPQGHREVAVRPPQSCRKGLYLYCANIIGHSLQIPTGFPHEILHQGVIVTKGSTA